MSEKWWPLGLLSELQEVAQSWHSPTYSLSRFPNWLRCSRRFLRSRDRPPGGPLTNRIRQTSQLCARPKISKKESNLFFAGAPTLSLVFYESKTRFLNQGFKETKDFLKQTAKFPSDYKRPREKTFWPRGRFSEILNILVKLTENIGARSIMQFRVASQVILRTINHMMRVTTGCDLGAFKVEEDELLLPGRSLRDAVVRDVPNMRTLGRNSSM